VADVGEGGKSVLFDPTLTGAGEGQLRVRSQKLSGLLKSSSKTKSSALAEESEKSSHSMTPVVEGK